MAKAENKTRETGCGCLNIERVAVIDEDILADLVASCIDHIMSK